jgi:hypothetical protein
MFISDIHTSIASIYSGLVQKRLNEEKSLNLAKTESKLEEEAEKVKPTDNTFNAKGEIVERGYSGRNLNLIA